MNLYQQRILEARKSFLKLNKEQDEELLKIYQELAKQLSSDIASCRTSSSEKYLRNLNKMLQINIDKLNTKLNSTIKSNIETSSQIASAVDLAYYESIMDDAKLRTMFNRLVVNTSMNTVKKLIQGNYYADGKTLDQRIWNITKSNAKDIDTLIKVNVAKGANARELAKEVERYVNPSKNMIIKNDYVRFNKNISYQSARLARTSITHAFSETTIQNAKRNPFCKGIKWNLSTSHSARMHGKMDMCDDYSGRVFKPNEVPLQHPNCLCYFTEENEDIDKVIDELKAWSRGESNSDLDNFMEEYGDNLETRKVYEVSKSYLKADSNDKGDISRFIKNLFNKTEVKKEPILLKDLPKEDLKNITEIVSNAPLNFQQLFLRYVDNIKFLDIKSKEGNKYSPKYNAIYINLKNDSNNVHGKGAYTTLFHELGHLIDKNMGRPSTNHKLSESFKSAIINDINVFVINVKNNYNIKSENELYEVISKQLKGRKEYHSISDIFGGVTMNKIVGKFKHQNNYWEREGALEKETFAHFFEATIRADDIKLKMLKNILPNAYDIFIKLLKEV